MNGLWWLCPLLLGALLGWLAHWLLDWLFTNQWRTNVKANHATMTGLVGGCADHADQRPRTCRDRSRTRLGGP